MGRGGGICEEGLKRKRRVNKRNQSSKCRRERGKMVEKRIQGLGSNLVWLLAGEGIITKYLRYLVLLE